IYYNKQRPKTLHKTSTNPSIIITITTIDHMGTLPPDQLEQLKDIFKRFDMDADGSLTQLELAALLRSLGIKPNGDQLHILLSNMDSNGNGSVEFDELVNVIMPDMSEQTLINQEQLLEVFQSFDRDGNGYITAAELSKSMAKMGHPLTYRELTEMMTEADTNGDGVISFNEFATIMARSATDFLGLTVALI
ncbi:EF_hand_5 domain-containing protein, partial [Cephalotus follicularis]